MHFHPGYVSISQVVKAIAECVAPPHNYQMLVSQLDDADRRPIDDKDASAIAREAMEWAERHKHRSLLSIISMSFRYSEAAAVLDQHLQNTQEPGPRWFDVAATGRPRRNNEASQEATAILLYLTKAWVRYEQAFSEGRLIGWPNCDFNQIEGFYGNGHAYRRFDEIMFDHDEILNFLKKFNIKHSGLDVSPVVASNATDDVKLPDEGSIDESENREPWSSTPQLTKKLLDASERERTCGLSTSAMAAAFGDTGHNRHKTSRDHTRWLQYLQASAPSWATKEPIRIAPGGPGRGKSAEWDPFEFAKAYVSKDFNGRWRAFNERFYGVEALKPWRQAWTLWVAEQRAEI
ncbi:hypothetical protein [Burkholderia ubonensis]|uniref:hypothetical protein n=1 Tax=Burkholderia ubonensis TaxID=101571 RepID=UPI0012F8E18C|nr:hypothetical protein [Burkholderia ubonensis]